MRKGENRLLPLLAKMPFGVYFLLAVVTLMVCIGGVILFFMTAAGRIYPEVCVEKTAVPVRDVNGAALDSSGNLYIGSAGYSAIQVFDQEGRFLERICIPTYKAVSSSFVWYLDDRDRLVIYTFRDYDRLEFEGGQAAVTAHYGDRPAFEAAVEEAGLDLYDSGKTWQGSDGTVCRVDLLGRVHVTQPGQEPAIIFLEVPRFPPPVPVCWIIAACGMLATVYLVLTAVRVEECRRRRPEASASGDMLKF